MKAKKTVSTVLICIFAAVFLFSAANLIRILFRYHKADKLYTDLQDRYVAAAPHKTGESNKENSSDSEKTPETGIIQVDFAALQAQYPDVVGWLYCEGTPINYPVVQADDNDYYLRRDIDGNSLVSGTLFADYRNRQLCEEPCTIIYGHNMDDNSMFGTLPDYDDAYYAAHPVIWFLTPEKNFKIALCAGVIVAQDAAIYQQPADPETLDDLIKNSRAQSTFSADVTVRADDRLLILSTCANHDSTKRYLLIGKVTEA